MYQKYYTEALVLGSRERGEADKVFALYTKDFGLVRARATAVRKETSRMRYALQNYAHVQVALVRGKRGWRVGGASVVRSVRGKGLVTFARIARLILRLVQDEGENPYVFAALSGAHGILAQSAPPTIELVCVARVLYGLGYLSDEAFNLPGRQAGTALFTHADYAPEHVLEAEALRAKLLSSVNRAIAETHL
jgi:DNA repair protein RecO (recombination protein O)